MPIQVKAPDGSIAQFPDGMADADIEKVMAQHFPQPSVMDRIAASPVGRFAHDAIVAPLEGAASTFLNTAISSVTPGVSPGQLPTLGDITEPTYQSALARNRNTLGYAAARAQADKVQAARGSGFTDQVLAPILPTLAGAIGLPGGLDASNANADAQAAAQGKYAAENPFKSAAAGVIGGLMTAPEGAIGNALKPRPTVTLPPAIQPQAADAAAAGYKLPPRMITDSPGIVSDAMSGWGGKTKLAQDASAANQEVTNKLAAQALGLPPQTMLTEKVLNTVRSKAGQSYAAIPKALPSVAVDPQFASEIQALGTKNTAAGAEFPDLMGNDQIDKLVDNLAGQNAKQSFTTNGAMDLVRQLRKNAKSNFKAADDPVKLDLAFAQRGAADAVDNLIERNLAAAGNQQLASQYRAARIQIAKAHDIEAATNTVTGNVSARKLGTMSARGKPFTGELATIADTAQAFPRAMQSEAAFGEVEPISVLDVAGAAAALPHNPSLLGAVLGRPIARKAMLSDTMQAGLINRASRVPSASLLSLPRLNQPISLPTLAALSLPQLGMRTLPQN